MILTAVALLCVSLGTVEARGWWRVQNHDPLTEEDLALIRDNLQNLTLSDLTLSKSHLYYYYYYYYYYMLTGH